MSSLNTNSDICFTIEYNENEALNDKYNLVLNSNKLFNDGRYNKISRNHAIQIIENFVNANFDERK